jgi:uncharacterized membrane protein
MAIGPVQLLVLGFNHPNFHGEITEELERLRESDTIRVIDALAVHKDADGELEVAHLSNLTEEEAVELGTKVGALIGLGIEGEEGLEKGAEAGAEAAADGVEIFSDEQAWDVLADIPDDSAAALLLIEHHWAVPLRDAIARAGGSGSATGSSARWTWSRSGSWRPRRPRSCTPWRRRLQNPSRDGYHCHELEVRGGTDVWIPQGRAAHRAAHRSTRRPPPLGVAHRSRPCRRDRQWPAEAGVRLRGGSGSPAAPAGRLAHEVGRYRGRASLATVEVGAERRHCVPGRPRQPGHRRAIHRGLERSRSDTMDDASAPSTGVVPCLRR